MKNIKIITVVIILIKCSCFAQDLPSIQTDRPDQTECPFITPTGFLQFENGFTYEKLGANLDLLTAPTILTRFGIKENFEIRLIFENLVDNRNNGINPVKIGLKTKLIEEKGIIPASAFIAHITFPQLASASLKQKYYSPDFRFSMQHTISKKQALSYNIGAEWNGESSLATFIYSLATAYSLTEKLGIYVEFYGFFSQMEKPDHRFNSGFTYLFNPNHQLDISSGLGLSKLSPNYFLSLGYSFRFKV